jgi:DeoR family transcriptional regulator of aga operon
MLDVERRQQVVAFIEQNNGATVAQLSEQFAVSEATVRRDLVQLSKQGFIERGHGGAVPRRLRRVQGLPEPSILKRASLQVEEKRSIGRAAAMHVEDGDVVIVNGGTTTDEMVPHLVEYRELTVLTNALNIASLLSPHPNVNVIIMGGVLRHSELSMLGAITQDTLSNLRADKLFMGSPAVHVDYGLSADEMSELQTDRAIMASAQEITVLADHTKFGKVATMRVAPIERVQRLITDTGTPEASITALREQGVEVEVVSAETERNGKVFQKDTP